MAMGGKLQNEYTHACMHIWKEEVMGDLKEHQVGETVWSRLLVSLLET